MGTRADFYVGISSDAEWLGSIGWDGYPSGIADNVKKASTEEEFRAAVAAFIAEEQGTTPEMGWPWPWNTSMTTDYAYGFASGRVMANDGRGWIPVGKAEEIENDGADDDEVSEEIVAPSDWPDMSARKNVALDHRSGLIILG